MNELRGLLTAMVTPFTADGAVDWDAARGVASHLMANGSHGIVVAGTTGESPTLTDGEVERLVREIRDEVGGGVPVICGTGTNDTRHTVELTRAAGEAGADAVLVVTPYYSKPNMAGLRGHYEAVAAVGVPVVLYNIPSRVVVNISPDELAELAAIDNVVAVKQANNDEVGEIPGLTLLAGNDDVFLRSLEAGGAGGILVASHVVGPQMRRLYDAFNAGDLQTAREIDASLAPVFDALAVTTNPIPVKAAVAMLGLCGPAMRLPMVPADTEQAEVVRSALEAFGVLEGAVS
jgi:4-hydroxy-tetrahydrodipicolinate synthase